MAFTFSEIIKTIDLEPYKTNNPEIEPFRFRIEVLRYSDTQKYYARIYRHEMYRIQPSFPQSEGRHQADHEIFVLDNFIGAQEFLGNSVDEVLIKVGNAINELFAH